MQRREQLLASVLGAIAVIFFGGSWLYSTFITPINERSETLIGIQKRIDEKMDQLVNLGSQRKKLKEWKARSLPPDLTTKTNPRPTALNAQRLYQDWLHDLAQLSGFEEPRISPGNLTSGNVFVSVPVKIDADARYDQLCHFLDRFYRANLLHRITSLKLTCKEPDDRNAILLINLEVEGLAIVKAPENRRLFPQTTLQENLSDDATVVHVESAEGFPTEPGFQVRLRSEFLTVTAMDGTSWTVQRGRDETTAATHPAGTVLELTPHLPKYAPRTAEEFKQLIDGDIFAKPAPPTQYVPKFGPLGEKSFTRGKPIEFNIVLLGIDPSKGRPEFSLVAPQIAGMRIDKSTGKFSWTPVSEQKSGTYALKFEAKHPSAASGRLQGSVNLVVRDPNTPPKLSAKSVPKVYLGQEWKFTPEAADAESSPSKLTWKLSDNAPQGIKINAKTGELTWKPDDSTEVGDATVQVIATDDGTPPQSATLNLRLKVEDDTAMFTLLTGIFVKDEDFLAQLYDRSKGKPTELRVGNQFAVADIKGTVTKIDKKYLLFSDGSLTRRLELGQTLRETVPAVAETADALRPANFPGQ